MQTVIATVLGALFTVVFAVVAWFVARRSADKGLMDKMPAASFPACYDLEGVRDDIVVEFLRAVEWWHEQMEDEFLLDEETQGLKIFVNTVDDAGDDYYARAKFVDDKPMVLMLINLVAVDRDAGDLFRAICHEIGHFLGLDHDQRRDSVMYHRPVEGDFELTAKDVELVKGRLWPS